MGTRAAAGRSLIALCDVVDLVEGRARGFDPYGAGRDTMFVVRRGAAVFAYRNECPHLQNARMAWRKDAYLNGDGSHIMCSAHGALFEIATGQCVIGPCLGKSLRPVALTLDGGRVFVAPAQPG